MWYYATLRRRPADTDVETFRQRMSALYRSSPYAYVADVLIFPHDDYAVAYVKAELTDKQARLLVENSSVLPSDTVLQWYAYWMKDQVVETWTAFCKVLKDRDVAIAKLSGDLEAMQATLGSHLKMGN